MPLNRKTIYFFVLICFVFQNGLLAQTNTGNFVAYTVDKNSVTVKAGKATVKFIFYAPEIVRVDYLPENIIKADSSFAVIKQAPGSFDFTVYESDSLLEIRTPALRIECRKFPVSLSFYNSSGKMLLSEPQAGGFSFDNAKRDLKFSLMPDDHFYGTGERGTDLDRRGQRLENYNTQIGGYDRPLSVMNINIPFFCTLSGYAIYFDNINKTIFDFGKTDSSIFSFTTPAGEISMYLFISSTVAGQLEKYTWLTGRQPLPPRWAFGFIQSKNRYENEAEVRAVVDTMRMKKIPCDAVVLDLGWFKNMGDLSWNESAWPHHEEMVTDFLNRGIKTILITEPYIIDRSINFKTAYEKGYLAKDSAGKAYLMEKWWSCGGCNSSLLDITNSEAARWWWSLHPKAFGEKVSGIWTDLGEPERHPEAMKHSLGSAENVHNIYNLLWAKTVFEGFGNLHPGRRVVNLTRSGFAGIQRYGALPWSGDVARSFGGLSVQPAMLLGMGLSGLAYHNSDIGGYSRIQGSPELYSRWMAYGIFCAITRVHGAGKIVKGFETEPWTYGPETEKISRDLIRLRYSLLPYIYTLAYQNYLTGLPFSRPLFFLDPSDKNLVNESSSFMFGDAFLVSPVVEEGINKKELYLPAGSWINFWTDEIITGNKTITAAAPLNRIPMFVRQGSIIPFAPVMNFTDERPLDTLIVHVYPAKDSSSYAMYEDDGQSLDYQKGAYAKTYFLQSASVINGKNVLSLQIKKAEGTFKGRLKERKILFQVHLIKENPASVLLNAKEIKRYGSAEELRSHENGFYFSREKAMLFIQLGSKPEETDIVKITY